MHEAGLGCSSQIIVHAAMISHMMLLVCSLVCPAACSTPELSALAYT